MKKFHTEIENLKKEVIKMGDLAIEMLNDSVRALTDLDMELAQSTHQKKDTLMAYENRLEEKTLSLIALYQPMASDLRTLACVLKMISNLTRIGRYGKDIANIVRKELEGKSHFKKLISIPEMTRIVVAMMKDTMIAFESEKLDLIKDLEERDDVVDEFRMSIFRECLTYMMEDPRKIPVGTAYIMVSRYLERCGDHACDIAEKIHYMVTGNHIEIN